jgi:hypothetical protein
MDLGTEIDRTEQRRLNENRNRKWIKDESCMETESMEESVYECKNHTMRKRENYFLGKG